MEVADITNTSDTIDVLANCMRDAATSVANKLPMDITRECVITAIDGSVYTIKYANVTVDASVIIPESFDVGDVVYALFAQGKEPYIIGKKNYSSHTKKLIASFVWSSTVLNWRFNHSFGNTYIIANVIKVATSAPFLDTVIPANISYDNSYIYVSLDSYAETDTLLQLVAIG